MELQDKTLPGWIFCIEEVSAGVYVVRATDREGRSVELSGTDPDHLLDESKKAALVLSTETDTRS
jgi:hypothetical protein